MIPGPVQFSNPPPPIIPNMSFPPPMPPPTNVNPMSGPPPSFSHPHHFSSHNRGGGHRHFFQPFRPYMRPGPGAQGAALDEFDGKRLRKSVMRKTVDYNTAIIKALETRVWQRDFRDRRALQPDVTYYPNLEPPPSYIDNPINSVVTRFVKTATNKMRCPIFCMAWTPEGRRLVTGASSGEFTLWNGLTFNFETILQAHDSPVRTMVWSHNDTWMVTGDHMGYVKYWQSNMNNVKMFQAHKEAIRGLSFSPTDQKFVTCSDDGTLRIWDFARCHEERILRGHGADVKCVHWHPQKSLIVSGSKDNQQPIKLWDPKTGSSLATLHAHKSTVMDIKWNANGNWLVTASRDHLLKLFDIRNLSSEVQTFRGHKKEASSVAWHPSHEGLFCSGGSDGAILFWHVGADKEVGGIEAAHDSIVWTLAWHPLGHILCSGSNDHSSKFWTRNRPGDQMRDKYNLNTLPAGLAGMEDQDIDDMGIIPGMGPEDKVEETEVMPVAATIPGLDFEGVEDKNKQFHKKVPYSKPIPKNFVAQWNETGPNEEDSGNEGEDSLQLNPIAQALRAVIENTKIPGCIPVDEIKPDAVIIYGKMTSVKGDDVLTKAIAAGGDTLQRMLAAGQIPQFQDVMPHVDSDSYSDVDLEDPNENVGHGTMPDLELPPPLPSSIFAKRGGPVAQRKTRFSEPEQMKMTQESPFPVSGDQDMRSLGNFHPGFQPSPYGDQDLRVMDPGFGRSQEDEDLRILRDIDLREEMMNKAKKFHAGGHFPPPGGFRDTDSRIQPPADGSWQQQQQPPPPQRWGPNDPIRPGLNNFGTRNFVSSGNFQNQPGNFAPNNGNPDGSMGNNFGSSGNYPNPTDPKFGVGNFPKSISTGNFGPSGPGKNVGHTNDPRSNMFGSSSGDGQFASEDNSSQGSWRSVENQGPPMGPRPQMGPGSMGPRMQMGPRSQMGPRHPMGPGGPQMGPGGPPQMGPGGPPMGPRGPGGPQMGPGGPQMGPGGPHMGPGGPPMGPGGSQAGPRPPMGPDNQGPPFQNPNPFHRGRGGFSRGRGGFESGRGGFESGRGGFESGRGGFESSRGGFDNGRGGFDKSRGGFDKNRGGFDGSRGGFDGSRGGFDGSRGGFDNSRGGFDNSRGGFDNNRGGFDGNRGGYENKRGGFDNSRFDNNRGDYDNSRGGYEKPRGRGGPPRGRFPGPRGTRGGQRGRPPTRERESESLHE